MKNVFLYILLIIVVGLSVIEFQKKILHKPIISDVVPTQKVLVTPQHVPVGATYTGEYVCLPRKDKKVSKTFDCLFGLKLQNGSYVALNVGERNSKESIFTFGNTLRVKGEFVPIEQISSDHWQQYPVTGILRASEITKL